MKRITLALLTLLILAACQPYTFYGTVIQSPDPAPDFTLEQVDGDITLSEMTDQVVVLFFGYTHCPDICPTTLFELKSAMVILGDRADQIQVMMVSVDPERDTPEALAEYVANFDERFMGVTGTQEEINRIATLYGVYHQKHDNGIVDHTASLVVVDRSGHIKLYIPPEAPAEAIAEDLKHILRQ